jgi:membrane-bound serine protease (ClpP class)
MGRRLRIGIGLFVAVVALAPAIAGAQSSGDATDVVVVADVRGPLEQRALDFLTGVVRTPDATLVVLQIDNPGIASGDPTELFEAIADSEIPVTGWVGPSGAEAYGGVAQALTLAAHRGAAPGARVGYLEDTMAGGGGPSPVLETLGSGAGVEGVDPAVIDGAVEVTGPVAGLVDEVVPTIGQFIASLDERPLETASGTVQVDTAETITAEDGSPVLVPNAEVRFLKPGLFTRTLRLSMRPEATFFFVVAGLALVVFELYAAGVGITATVAALALFLGGFGIASLPMSWPALAATVLGIVLYTIDFQNARITWRGLLGTGALLYGGFFLTDAAPQFTPRWWAVLLVLVGLVAFYLVALTTVARSRFSTITIGREHLIGRIGVAETGFDPTGVVVVDGARWRARSHRAAGLAEGDRVEVTSVAGIMLEVGPLEPPADGPEVADRDDPGR